MIRELFATKWHGLDRDALAREFPDVSVSTACPGQPVLASLDIAAWTDAGFDPFRFDAQVGEGGGEEAHTLELRGTPGQNPTRIALQVLTRYQSFVRRRNEFSTDSVFGRILETHRSLHDLSKPLVRADWVHSLDVWQWTLRIDPAAARSLQVAALFHDVERLQSEADVRIEQHAADYEGFKHAHARAGARLAKNALEGCGLDAAESERILHLVEAHEGPGESEELRLLNDADGLSFFSLNGAGFLAYYGDAHTRRKIAYTLRRMSPSARARLSGMRFQERFERLLRETRAAGAFR